ncbi:MAG: V-type ATP synthase subunit I [Spirochaetaceae bacterium]
MMFTSPMRYLFAAVPDSHAEDLSRELLHLGVLHFVDVRELDRAHALRAEEVGEERRRIAEVRRRIESTLATGNLDLPDLVSTEVSAGAADVKRAEELTDDIGRQVESLRTRQRELQQQIMRLEELRRQVALYGEAGRAAGRAAGLGEGHGYLDARAGTVPRERIEEFRAELGAYPAMDIELRQTEDRVEVLLLTLKRNASSVAETRRRHGWQDLKLPDTENISQQMPSTRVEAKLESAREEQQELGQQAVEAVRNHREELESAWRNLRHRELELDVRSFFEHTERTVVFSGWVPREHARAVEDAVRRATGGKCYLRWYSDSEMSRSAHVNVPVRLHNPRLLRPFQMLVENYGTPSYGTVDPTVLVAAAYLVMFGLMFADAGHGLVLLIGGILGLRSKRIRGRTRELFGLLTWCAVSAIAFGVLFGAYFGMQLLPPLWFDFHAVVSGHAGEGAVRSIYDILVITIYLGITVIGLGFVLNWINLLRRGKRLEVVFDRAGLITAWLYAGGIYEAYRFAQSGFRELPVGRDLLFALVLPALLLLLKEPAEAVFGHRAGAMEDGSGATTGGRSRGVAASAVAAVMNWLLELLEVATGYLSNTLSFMRVAGLGIAHVTLMTAFFEVARLAAGDGGFGVFSVLILVLGNALVIGLEGLSAAIQSLRLNYYEFFSKYFSGSGEVYRPISLAGRS